MRLPIPVMEPVRVEVPRPRAGWSVEVKWDGVRVLAHRDAGRVRFYGRSGREYTERLGDLALRVLEAVDAGEVVLDGEVVAWAGARPSFPQAVRALNGARDTQVTYEVFDLLGEDGQDLRTLPWRQRRERLERRLVPGDVVHPTRVFDGEAATRVYRAVGEMALEGVVLKDLDSPYVAGKSRYWEKVKHEREQVFRVTAWERKSGGTATLHLTDRDGRPVGSVSSGLRGDQMAWLRALTGDGPQPRVLPPGVEARLRFHGWTAAGKVRHPRLLSLAPFQ